MKRKAFWFLALGSLFVAVVVIYMRQQDLRQRDEHIFRTSTPEQHFIGGLQSWYGRDFGLAIRHLEAVPKDSPVYKTAARTIRLVKIQHDRPQDFEAAKTADYQQCADQLTQRGAFCGVYIDGECDLYNYHYLRHEVIESLTLPTTP